MLSEESLFEAIAAAKGDLVDREDCKWIEKSAWAERAYYFGLCNGLEAIAAEGCLSFLRLLTELNTWCARDADDPFRASEIGRSYQSLVRNLKDLSEGSHV